MLLNKKEERANGKIVICDFRKLNHEDFKPLSGMNRKEFLESNMQCSVDGKLYIDSRVEFCDFVSDVFESLMAETYYKLQQFQKQCKAIFPKIKTINDWERECENMSDKEKTYSFAMLCVPIEINRRRIEKAYYTK